MFKNLIMYRIAPTWQMGLEAVHAALQQRALFMECGATQEHACGLVPVRGAQHGALIESVGGQWMLCFMQESKILPSCVLERTVQEKAAHIEHETGRKPGKKYLRDLKDEAKLDLLPQAFTKQSRMWVWIDPNAHWLVLDTPSQSRADEVVGLLTQWLPGLVLALLDTATTPQTAMAHWLKDQDPPYAFSIDQECELKSEDTTKAVVRYTRHALDIEEVRAHIAQGKRPTKLALTWNGRVSFVLTEGLQLKKVHFLESVYAQHAPDDGGFDGDMAIATGELGPLLADLVQALGGEGRSAVMMAPHSAPNALNAPNALPDSAPF